MFLRIPFGMLSSAKEIKNLPKSEETPQRKPSIKIEKSALNCKETF